MEIKLKTQDMFKLLKVVKKTGMFNNIKDLFKTVGGKSEKELEEIQTKVGMDIVVGIISNLDLAEKEIYDLVASITGKKAKDIAEQDPMETMEVLQKIINDDSVKSFLSSFSE